MKRLTLDETWRLCLSMWRWIAKQKRLHPYSNIRVLKRRWAEKHGYFDLEQNCFFCEYTVRRELYCEGCPGAKVDKMFRCARYPKYIWYSKPIAFYKKLVSLNRKRLAKKN
ncbi:MAG: hypothetical protein ACYS1A_19875 [Planctomycetota bacterium]|jgi:hypothetical protein